MPMRISRFKLVAMAAAVLWVFSLVPSFAQDNDGDGDAVEKMDWLIWDSVQRLTGQATIHQTGWIERDDGVNKEKVKENSSATLHFELVREPQNYSRGHSRWIAEKVRVSGNAAISSLDDSPTYRLAWSSHAAFDQTVIKDAVNLSLSLNHETGEFQLTLPSRLDTPVPDRIKRSEWRLMEETVKEERTQLLDNFASTLFNGRAPTDIGVLNATSEDDYLEEDGRAGHRTIGRVVLLPEYDDFKVVVEFDSYDDKGKQIPYEDWRPFGSIKEPGTPGNHINVKAVLHPKGDKKPADLPKVKFFHFELLETSQELGVAMNWPMFSEDNDPDLMLAMDLSSPGVLTPEGQQLDVSNPVMNARGLPTASARIQSFDFGGRTMLRVTAKLADGRLIFGRLEGQEDTLYPGILIPKRRPGRWIAEAWLTENGVAKLLDDDDAESEPMGDGFDGDGLTMYQEYRGFAVDRMKNSRMEGDPKRKDLFILNLIGEDAQFGIDLFEKASGLRIIQSRDEEVMNEEKRVINMNHSAANEGAAPHREEDQHGVVLKTMTYEEIGHHGARTIDMKEHDRNYALKPENTRVVGVPARKDKESMFNQPFNLPADDIAMMLDRVIAHELLHSVGVWHHGYSDHNAEFRYIPASYKGNKRGEPVLWMRYAVPDWNHDVDVFEEATGVSFAKRIAPALDIYLNWLCAEHTSTLDLPPGATFADLDSELQEIMIQQLPTFDWHIGVEHGQHSGNEQCPMRYAIADLYPAKDSSLKRETYYLVPAGTEDVGATLCKSPVGTGVNDAKRNKPQSRYGDASDTASGGHLGNCDAQIYVNDAAPDRKLGYVK